MALISEAVFSQMLSLSILFGIIGGRILWFLEQPSCTQTLTSFLSLWNGGLSILGTIIALIFFIPLYLYLHAIQILPTLNCMAPYFPLVQCFGRLGCFFTGCCYGISTTVPWAITYSNPDVFAPLNVPLHPTQLYEAFSYFVLFFLLLKNKSLKNPLKNVFGWYLVGISLIRFFVDFLRADHTLLVYIFSPTQCIAFVLIIVGTFFIMTKDYADCKPKSF